ncbi:hypothetical protein GQ600_232 [Phytophthora cactorum]|nr:hypothetical protein GQ600_232 [Phytophthora cactorum]
MITKDISSEVDDLLKLVWPQSVSKRSHHARTGIRNEEGENRKAYLKRLAVKDGRSARTGQQTSYADAMIMLDRRDERDRQT